MKKRLLFLLSLAVLPSYAMAQDEDIYRPTVSVGGKFGNERDIGETEILIPIRQKKDALLYGDIRFRDESGTGYENNFGIGFRKIEGETIYGAYGIIDRRVTPNNNAVGQVTFGGEIMTAEQDARLNIYLPDTSEKTIAGNPELVLAGTQYFIEGANALEQASPGFDVEFGQKIPYVPFDLRLYAAGYHYFQEVGSDMTGARLRTTATTPDIEIAGHDFKLQVEAEAQHDNIRDDTFFAGGRVIIPFGKKPENPLTPLQQRMTEHPERDVDIVVSEQGETLAATADINGLHFAEVHEVALGVGGDLAATMAGIDEGALVRVSTDTPQLVSTQIDLKDGQGLVGSGRDIALQAGRNTIGLEGNGGTTDIIKATAIGASNALVTVSDKGNAGLYDLTLTNEDTSTGDANVMVSSQSTNIKRLDIDNIQSDGALHLELAPIGNISDINISDSEIYGGFIRGGAGFLDITLDNNTFHRGFAHSNAFGQDMSASFLIDANGADNINLHIDDNNFIDNKVADPAWFTTGFMMASNGPTNIFDYTFEDNTVSRAVGVWDIGGIVSLNQGSGFFIFNTFHGNTADNLVAENTFVNIQDFSPGITDDAAGIAAANNGTGFTDIGATNTIFNIYSP